VDIRVLGGIEVLDGERRVALAALPRRLLVVLVTRTGESATPDVLIEALWGGRGPPSAAKLLQVYVSQLRKALPSQARIHTTAAGYALELADGSLDADLFERLLDDARAVMRDGNPALAVSLLDRALALWRGPAYGEFAYDEFARGEADRLEELRLAAAEDQIEMRLALGQHTELLPELQALTAAEPLSERRAAQMMLALYRCGRQNEALELFSTTRASLLEELGLEPGSELRDLQRRILQQDPTLTLTVAARVSRPVLPASPNALLGRGRELAELRSLLAREDTRLVVLTGAGGSGKTRLALEVARATTSLFANGAAFVELAPISDPAGVLGAITRTLSIDGAPGESPLQTLANALRPRELLLVLDNAEHLLPAGGTFSDLLAHAPRLTLLVTSRAVLHLSGEYVYPVGPLDEEPAVALFRQRAREAEPRFKPAVEDEQTIRQICARLDGLPLAIELAAARTRVLTLSDLLERLEHRLPLLTGGPHDLPARQRTLRATLEWSFNLLDEDECHLASGLAVFRGDFDLNAAVHISGADVDALTALVDQSLLTRTADGRFYYLETIRELALERLQGSSEADELHRRHLEHYLHVVEQAVPHLRTDGEREALAVIDRELDNIRGALQWALDGEPDSALRLAGQLGDYWLSHHDNDGLPWLEAALEAAGEHAPARDRARAQLHRATQLYLIRWEHRAAIDAATSALALYREADDHAGIADALCLLATLIPTQGHDGGERDQASRYAEEACLHARVAGNNRILGKALATLAAVSGDVDVTILEEAAELLTRVEDHRELARAYSNAAWRALAANRVPEATSLAETALRAAEKANDRFRTMIVLSMIGFAKLFSGDLVRAQAAFERSIELSANHALDGAGEQLVGIGAIAAEQLNDQAAARLLGAARAAGYPQDIDDQQIYDRLERDYFAAARARYRPAPWRDAEQAGAALSYIHAMAEALEVANAISTIGTDAHQPID